MTSIPHFHPYIVDEDGNPVPEIPRSNGTVLYHYETRIVDRMPAPQRPRSKSTLEKIKGMLKNPEEVLRVPGNMLETPKARPVLWAGAQRGEGRYYYVDQGGRFIETTVTRIHYPPAPSIPCGNIPGAVKVAKDKDVVADAAERLNNAVLFARAGSGGVSGHSGASASGSGTSGPSFLGLGSSGGPSSGMGTSSGLSTSGGFSDGSGLFDW